MTKGICNLDLDKFPKVNIIIRLKQLICCHKTMSIGAYTQGINSKKGYNYVVYTCSKCGYCIGRWVKMKKKSKYKE
jgi:RNase P subunit RPR2